MVCKRPLLFNENAFDGWFFLIVKILHTILHIQANDLKSKGIALLGNKEIYLYQSNSRNVIYSFHKSMYRNIMKTLYVSISILDASKLEPYNFESSMLAQLSLVKLVFHNNGFAFIT